MDGGIRVVGMYLERKHFFRENKFHKKREVVFGGKLRAAPFLRHFGPGFSKRFAAKLRSGDFTIKASEPGFAEGLREIGFFRIERRQRASAPYARTKNRLESLWRRLHESGRGLGAREKVVEAAQAFV